MTNSPLFACTGKQGFNTFIEGNAAIKRIRKFGKMAKDDGDLDLYRCPYCPKWHIGHRTSVRSKRLVYV